MSVDRVPPSDPVPPAPVHPFPTSRAVDYDAILDRVFTDVAHREAELARERSEAPGLLGELERVPAGRQKLLIRNSRRFQTWALARLLIDAGHRLVFDDPVRCRELAELATEVVERLDEDWYGQGPVHDLKAAAWAELGNALRINGELRRSEEAFGIAEHLLTRGSGDPLEVARVLDLKASLRRTQHRLDESLALLDAAIHLYEEVGDRHRAGRALIKQGIVNDIAGKPELAIRQHHEGLARVDTEAEPQLALAAAHNLIVLFADHGRPREAHALLLQTRRLYDRHGNDTVRLRLRWVEGKIACGLGRFEEAERAFLEARQGFIDRGVGYTAAMVCLDLAALYSEEGRAPEMKRLAVEMLPIFRAQDVHREAMAALLVFRQAVEAEQATRGLIDEVRTYLAQARENPRLRFSPGTPPPSGS